MPKFAANLTMMFNEVPFQRSARDGLSQSTTYRSPPEIEQVIVPHASLGSVFVVNPDGEPIARVLSPRGKTTTNVKFGGPDRKTMFITESSTGSILSAPWTTPGRKLYAEMGGVP
jgi:SMP-30/gluconolaconase/LRE-like protein